MPVVNPRRGKLARVEVTPDHRWVALGWGVLTFVVLVAAAVVTVTFGDSIGGFIYATF